VPPVPGGGTLDAHEHLAEGHGERDGEVGAGVREAFGEGQDEDRGGTFVEHVLQREEERVRRAEGGDG